MTSSEKEWFIEAPWGKLCVVAWGDCYSPPVLVCHGYLDSAATFRPLINLLPKNFYYICLELPGLGKSDPFPPGLMINGLDMVYSIQVVVQHFRWKSFIYVAHSMGCALGKFYDLAYPGKISRVVDLDPVYGYLVVPPEKFADWYKKNFTDYIDNYNVYNMRKDRSPKYKKEELVKKLMSTRGFSRSIAEASLERLTEPTDDGHIRFTYDHRHRVGYFPPFSKGQIKKLFTDMATPTLSIIAEESKNTGRYNNVEFLFDETSYAHNNYRYKIVPGSHEVHLVDPHTVAVHVATFLLNGNKDFESKL